MASPKVEQFSTSPKLENELPEYRDKEQSPLQHFQFKDIFIIGKKNAYVTSVPTELISEICSSEELTYAQIVKRLKRGGLKLRLNEYRDYFASSPDQTQPDTRGSRPSTWKDTSKHIHKGTTGVQTSEK